jgi:putative endonuclease
MAWVYVLWSQRLKKRYVGCTHDLETRIRQHNSGQSKFTSGGIPWVVIHKEHFDETSLAFAREKFLKSGVGRKWLDGIGPEDSQTEITEQ